MLVAPVLLAVLAVVGVLTQVPQNKELSPIDEWVYVDYLAKVPTQGVVTQGEATGEYAREVFACRGVEITAPPNPTLCDQVKHDTESDASFPMHGTTSADIYTPLYFWTTWAMAEGFRLVGVQDFVMAASAAGAVWLAAAMVFLWAALRRFGVPPLATIGIGTLLLATPVVFWSDTFVSTDAPTLLVASALLWLFARIAHGSSGRIAFVAVSVVGVLFKVQNILAVGTLALALAAWGLSQAWASRAEWAGRASWLWRGLIGRDVLTAVGAAVLSVVAQGVWIVVRAAISTGPSPDQGVGVRLRAVLLAKESMKFLFGAPADPTGRLGGIWYWMAAQLVILLAIGGVLALVFMGRRGSAESWMARSTLLLSLLGGPLLAIGTTAVAGYYFALPTRYGLPLLPMLLACAGIAMAKNRWMQWILVVVAAVCWVGVLRY